MELLETAKVGLRRVLSRMSVRLKLDGKVGRKNPEDPDEPYALVGALKKPRTPLQSRAATAPLTFEEPGR